MIHRRGVLPVLLLLGLVLVGTALQIVRGSAGATPAASPALGARATPAPTGAARGVLRSLGAVERAYDAGEVRRLCRAGVLVDPAVIRAQNARRNGCESEIESLIAAEPRLRMTVRGVTVGRALATADVATTSGAGTSVDFVRRGGRWLLSFSEGGDPMPVLAGSA